MEGWRMATVARLPIYESAWPRPTVVVVLPSPSGVGVIVFRQRPVRELLDRLQPDLGHVVSVGLEQMRADAHLGGHVGHRKQTRLARDLEVGRERNSQGFPPFS
jgi:hypothetical protein